MQITFTKEMDKIGYPFFKLSSFSAWIAYKDGNKRTRLSIETNTTLSQLISGRIQEFKLDKTTGLNNLINMINKQRNHIKVARIYFKGLNYDDNKLICEFKDGEWITFTKADLNKPVIANIPFQVLNNQLVINLNLKK